MNPIAREPAAPMNAQNLEFRVQWADCSFGPEIHTMADVLRAYKWYNLNNNNNKIFNINKVKKPIFKVNNK